MIYKIYKIECLTTGKIYIGQTRNKIRSRIIGHITTFNSGISGYCDYSYSHDILLNNNFSIEVIDEVNCNCLCKNIFDINCKYNALLPNNLEAFYMNYFKSINGTKYNYGLN